MGHKMQWDENRCPGSYFEHIKYDRYNVTVVHQFLTNLLNKRVHGAESLRS
jgi:hypothetical protein